MVKGKTNFQKESSRILTYLYSLVIALALTTVIKELIVSEENVIRSPLEIPIYDALIFFTFLAILIPFYHGTIVFLVRTYEGKYKNLKKGELLFDVLVKLMESIILFAMAVSTSNVEGFIGWFIVLLVVNILWVCISYIKAIMKKLAAPKHWGLFNFFTVIFLIGYLTFNLFETTMGLLFLFGVVLGRSIADYYFSYDYYFSNI
jgi:hypothetical protein